MDTLLLPSKVIYPNEGTLCLPDAPQELFDSMHDIWQVELNTMQRIEFLLALEKGLRSTGENPGSYMIVHYTTLKLGSGVAISVIDNDIDALKIVVRDPSSLIFVGKQSTYGTCTHSILMYFLNSVCHAAAAYSDKMATAQIILIQLIISNFFRVELVDEAVRQSEYIGWSDCMPGCKCNELRKE
jgi:hypothetical protein